MVPIVNKLIVDNLALAADPGIVPPVTDISTFDEDIEAVDDSDVEEADDSEEDEYNNLVIEKNPRPVIRSRPRNPLQCLKCGKELNNQFNYDRHVNAITQCDEILKCGLCDKQFPNMSKYKRHSDHATSCY